MLFIITKNFLSCLPSQSNQRQRKKEMESISNSLCCVCEVYLPRKKGTRRNFPFLFETGSGERKGRIGNVFCSPCSFFGWKAASKANESFPISGIERGALVSNSYTILLAVSSSSSSFQVFLYIGIGPTQFSQLLL